MKNKLTAILCLLAFILCFAGCGEEAETTLTGIVVSVDGTVVSLRKMDSQRQENAGSERPSRPESDERPTRPEGSEDFTRPEGFEPGDPNSPKPEGFRPGNLDETLPEGATAPERPAGGERPDFGGNRGDITEIDLAGAHISVEIDGGKASGTMEDITAGTFLTITLNEKGEAVSVLVSSGPGFGRGFRGADQPAA